MDRLSIIKIVEECLEIYNVVQGYEDIIITGRFRYPQEEHIRKLDDQLRNLGYIARFEKLDGDIFNIYIAPIPERKPDKLWIHALLFVLTIITTLMAGAFQMGVNPLEGFNILAGVPFSLSIMLILLSHEMGHYVMARIHRVDATLPYFIPFPNMLIGTMGAVIRIKSPIPNRKALLEIGAMGPWAGFVVALPITLIGLKLSSITPSESLEGGIMLGESIMFKLLSWIALGDVPDGYDVQLHPMAFAGWLGLFITSLNLLPIGQLDGGHVVYAVLGRKQRTISVVFWFLLIVFGMLSWSGWLVWALLTLILGIKHPGTLNDFYPLDRKDKLFAYSTMVLFVLTFVPSPMKVI